MNTKQGFILIILILSLIFISGCSENNDAEELPTESPTQTNVPVDPTPTPFQQDDNFLVITKAELICENEQYAISAYNSQLNCHSGKAILRLFTNKPLTEDIVSYLLLNDKPVDSQTVTFGKNNMSIYLNDSLPYLYTFKIKTAVEYPHDSVKIEYSLELLHEDPLTYTVSYYDLHLQKNTPQAMYISEKDPTFLIEFSKPVKRDTLELARSNAIVGHSIFWLSKTEVLVYMSNLSNGNHSLGIAAIEGESDIYGNTLSLKTTYSEVESFQIADPQTIYSVVPEKDKAEVIGEISYGTFFESISNDYKTLSLGIISKSDDDFSYTKAFYDINLRRLTLFSTFINQAVSEAAGQQINIMDSFGYPSDDNRDYWNSDGNYIYGYEGSLYTIDPATLKVELFHRANTDLSLDRTFVLKNGNYAAVNRPFNINELLELIILNQDGDIINQFELPFREILIENYMHYVTIVNDPGDGTLLICGFERLPDAGYTYKTFRMNLTDGSLALISENSLYVGIYPELGYGFYYNYTDSQLKLEAISFEGKLLKTIPVNDTRPRGIVYNPQKNVFYMLKYDLYEQSSKIMIIDAETFKISDTSLKYENFIQMIGISENGELLLMDMPGN